jgi:hypothetical protein
MGSRFTRRHAVELWRHQHIQRRLHPVLDQPKAMAISSPKSFVNSVTAAPVAEVAGVRSAAAVMSSAVRARYVLRPRHCRKHKIQSEFSIQLSDIGYIGFSMGKFEKFSLVSKHCESRPEAGAMLRAPSRNNINQTFKKSIKARGIRKQATSCFTYIYVH